MSDASKREWRFYLLELIGEAAIHIPEEIRSAHQEI